jgi:hypothetical protein
MRRVHRAVQPRPEQQLHRPQAVLRRGRGARLPAVLAERGGDHRGAPRPGAPREAVLPARPHRQVGAHQERAARPSATAPPPPDPRAHSPPPRGERSGEGTATDGIRAAPAPRTLSTRSGTPCGETLPDGTALSTSTAPTHEVTSPQAFEGCARRRKVRRPDATHRGGGPQHATDDSRYGSDRGIRKAARRSRRWSATSPNSACPTSR